MIQDNHHHGSTCGNADDIDNESYLDNEDDIGDEDVVGSWFRTAGGTRCVSWSKGADEDTLFDQQNDDGSRI